MEKLKKSFTIIELVIALGVMSIAIGITAGVLVAVVKSYQKQQLIGNITSNGDRMMGTFEEKIRNANSVYCVEYDAGQPGKTRAASCDPGGGGEGIYGGTSFLLVNQGATTGYFGFSNITESCNSEKIYAAFYTEDVENLDGSAIPDGIKLTNHDENNGVSISEFDIMINTENSTTKVLIDATVKNVPCSGWNIPKQFSTFITARGSY